VERVDQHLARAAAAALPHQIDPDMRTRLLRLPSMVMTHGLTAAGAYLLSRAADSGSTDITTPEQQKQSAYRNTAVCLLTDAAEFAGITVDHDPNATLGNIAAAPLSQYRLAEARGRAFAHWVARLTAARTRTSTDPNTAGAEGDDE
jgi:hypothetical protein